MPLLRGEAIVVDPTLSGGANQAICVSATAAGLFAVYWDSLSASRQCPLLRALLALKERRDTTPIIYVSPRGTLWRRTRRRSHFPLTEGHHQAFVAAAWVLAGWSPP
jgi:hypothetical protein